jgi:hypothetical protein
MLLCSTSFAQAPSTGSAVPDPLVERTVSIDTRQLRISLFDNRVVVVSARRDGEQTLFRQMTLEEDEFVGYLAALQRDAIELAERDRRTISEATAGVGVITFWIGPKVPNAISYSSVAVLDLVTARLVATLDDLEGRVIWGDPSAADLEGWVPKRGDRVELRTGTLANVVELRKDGTLVLEHDDTWIIQVIAAGEWHTVVRRVLRDQP